MSTTSAIEPVDPAPVRPAVPAAPAFDGRFAKRFVIVCGVVPAALLLWDAYRGQLGVNSVNFAIRSTGMLGLVFLSLSLCVTPIRRLTGWNWLIGVRRNIGVLGFSYIAAHFLIFFWYDRARDVGSTLNEIVEREYLWYGTGALVIMIPLAITSTDAMVLRLGAKRWKALHRFAYLAVAAGVYHFYLLAKADKTIPLVFGGVFTGLMLYRGVRHYLDLRGEVEAAKDKIAAARKQSGPKKKKFWQGELMIARVFQETPDVKTFRMVNPEGGPLPFEHTAGQYLNISTMIEGKRVGRSYTIASSPTRSHYVEISVKRDGLFSKHLHANVKEGDRVRVGAPAGKFYFAGHEAKRVVLVAGGVGITPMMSVIRSLTDRCWMGEMYLLFAVRKRHDIIFERELEHLQQRFPNLKVAVTLSDDPEAAWDGARGRITKELVSGFVPDLRRGPVMLCGPKQMMEAMRKLFVELGVPDHEVLEEAFSSPAMPAASEGAPKAEPSQMPAEPAEAGGEAPNVNFQKTGKIAELPSDLTVLEVAEDCGVAIPFECRSGICGQCKTRLVSGRVTMEVQDALTPADRSRGLILACQAKAVKDVVVDA
jgi:glycine betaine catabolism B